MTRVTRRSKFAAIPNAAMRDERLSIEARGLLALMMGMGDNWTFRGSDLMKRCGVGKEKYQGMVRNLKECGYLEIEYKQAKDGKMDGFEYTIIDAPDGLKTRQAVQPPDEEPGNLRTPTLKNTNNKTPTPKGADLFSAESETKKQDQTSDLIEEGFKDFWDNIWPRHERKAGKADCRKVYDQACRGKHPKAEKIAPADLNEATRRYIASVKDRQFLKGPLPWLRAPGWEPFIGTAAPSKPMSYAARLLAGQAR